MALGRLLTPAEFGLMGAATVVIACSQIVSQIGVGPAIIQRRDAGADPPAGGRHAVLHARLPARRSIVWFSAPRSSPTFYRMPDLEPVLRAVAFLFPLDGLNTVAKSLLTRQLRFRSYVALDAGSYIVGYACHRRVAGLDGIRRLGAGHRQAGAGDTAD